MKLVKAMATVAGLTGLSRIAGFIRDILTASILGAGPVADAFFVALKLPNFFRRITAEGAFSVSFVPLYTESMELDGPEAADAFASKTLAVMFTILSVFTVLAILFMPWVIYAIAPGFHDDPVRSILATELARITFPYLLLMSMTALLGGILNALDRFAPFAAAPILFNLSLIGALLFLTPVLETAGHAMAWGIFAAGILQFGLLFLCIKRANVGIRFVKPKITGRIKRLFKLMGPGVIGAGVMHINLFADLIIASMLTTGSISYLYYADRINQLPLGIVGIAVGTALLPMLSKTVAAGKTEEAKKLFSRALEICFLFALPAAFGIFMISMPIVVTLFEHGEFTKEDSITTIAVLTSYAVGMPAYVAIKVFSTAFWAKQDTVTPVKVSIIATIFNIGLSLWLAFSMGFGVVGIAVGTATAGWIQFGLLAFFLRNYEEAKLDKDFYIRLIKIFACCYAMAIYLAFVRGSVFHLYYPNNAETITQILSLILLVAGGMIVYGLAVMLTGVVRLRDIKNLLKGKT
jgi:putative peptidoglycan lipid II flippase